MYVSFCLKFLELDWAVIIPKSSPVYLTIGPEKYTPTAHMPKIKALIHLNVGRNLVALDQAQAMSITSSI